MRDGRRAKRLGLVLLLAAAAWAGPAASEPPTLSPTDRRLLQQTVAGAEALGEQLGVVTDDASLVEAARRHAEITLGQRIVPPAIDPMWSIAPPRRNAGAELQAALAEGRLAAWLNGLAPADPQYRLLSQARMRYARLAAAGGWPPVSGAAARSARPDFPTDLRARLIAEGYLPVETEGSFASDAAVKKALAAFQQVHGLAVDGALGPQTLAELNISAAERVDQIDANLERLRWSPPLPADRAQVDIGRAELTLYQAGAPRLQMRVIVGDPGHHTPMFASRLEAVVLNPPWNVPASIAAKELYPKEAAHPGYLARNHIRVVDGQLQQAPGPKNSLGRLKFDLPSPFGVYLHDTPARSLFAQTNRALSHGCIRLEQPRELAAILLAPKGWTAQALDTAIEAGPTLRIALPRQTPLYVVYSTAWVDGDGAVNFRKDVYGWDHRLVQALAARPLAAAKAPPATECQAGQRPSNG